ncbi:MAG: hypothetical protein QG656_249 [Candidatus Hydrogenedentes bacterium]|nr:hypothetical protein [Candidatus Hydrogenedentota bacterium]
MMTDNRAARRVAVIMAGGAGERFWPLSRRLRPKQLLPLTRDDESMLAEAVRRVAPVIAPEHIYVVTGEHLVEAIRAAHVGVPDENVIAEPCKRNTAGCLTYAAAHLLAKYGGDGGDLTMAVLTADQQIGEEDLFRETVRAAMEVAEAENVLVTLGIRPTRPETGYGYIQFDRGRGSLGAYGGVPFHGVQRFHEKPDAALAMEFLASGDYCWNSGMFFWRVSVFLAELSAAAPAMAAAAGTMASAMRDGRTADARRAFEALDDISIDYALMEKSDHVVMAEASFPWDDVGSWPALDRTRTRDASGNVMVGDPVIIDCRGSIVYKDVGEEVAVSVVGMDDVVVIVTRDAVLVVPKARAQDVRQAVEELTRRNAPQVR